MRYRDKDGNAFEDIERAATDFCLKIDCYYDYCPINRPADGKSCRAWILDHPAEAARLMGYEVVEDEREYVFSVRLADNDVDKDYERFELPALEKLRELYLGKSGFLGKGIEAKILATEIVKDSAKKTAVGDTYCWIKATASIPNTPENSALIQEIENKQKEVSVGCSVGKRVCSICGEESCGHALGETYNEKLCYYSLQEPLEAYEWAFVTKPKSNKKEANMDKQKPPKDWTLGEVQEYCQRMHGDVCYDDAEQNDCLLRKCNLCCNEPREMDLTEKSRFTEEEVEDARAIMRLMYLVWDDVVRDITGELSLKNQAGNRMPIQHTLFPSILPGQTVKLSDIVGGTS